MNSSDVHDPNILFKFNAPVSVKRHQHLVQDEQVPRTKNFNPDRVRNSSFFRVRQFRIDRVDSHLERIGFYISHSKTRQTWTTMIISIVKGFALSNQWMNWSMVLSHAWKNTAF